MNCTVYSQADSCVISHKNYCVRLKTEKQSLRQLKNPTVLSCLTFLRFLNYLFFTVYLTEPCSSSIKFLSEFFLPVPFKNKFKSKSKSFFSK